MIKKIMVVNNDKLVYKGKILDIPIKHDYIIKKSIEIFDDDDPCIIHQSYVIKQIVQDLLEKTNLETIKEVNLSTYQDELSYLNFALDNTIIKAL